jgi:Na+/H+ antiporter NhaD/arsenite permease-like protein
VLLVSIFVAGYLAIVFEQALKLNKSASALLTGVLCWAAYALQRRSNLVSDEIAHHFGEISQVLFFLLAAMTIVEQIDLHDGFELITSRVRTTNRRTLLVTVAILTFLLSAVLDNLTTAILMMSLVRRLVADDEDRMVYGGAVIVAANAGGAWSPIGDVTTTMLWVGQQITSVRTMTTLFFPALVSMAVPTLWLALRMKGDVRSPNTRRSAADGAFDESVTTRDGTSETSVTLPAEAAAVGKTLAELDLRARTGIWVTTRRRDSETASPPSPTEVLREGDVLIVDGPHERVPEGIDLLLTGIGPRATTPKEQRIVFASGVFALLFVPVFRAATGLPPVLGILLGLGFVWLVTELVHKRKGEDRKGALSVATALQRIDAPSVLFFLGILLAIGALQADGALGELAHWMANAIGSVRLITLAIGLASSVIDNVPLVAAAQGMYSRADFPTDHGFWLFLAYCAGTGGSILIIGSAAGVAVMGSQRIGFGWYLRKISLPALLG